MKDLLDELLDSSYVSTAVLVCLIGSGLLLWLKNTSESYFTMALSEKLLLTTLIGVMPLLVFYISLYAFSKILEKLRQQKIINNLSGLLIVLLIAIYLAREALIIILKIFPQPF